MQIGIIAGSGDLPEIIAGDAKERGYKVITIALENLASSVLNDLSDEIKWINVGKLGAIINALKGSGVREAIMAGKVPKSLLYKSKVTPDLRAIKLLFSLKDKSDDSILNALADELAKESPSQDEWADIKFGWKIAKAIGEMDIGQAVVVKGQAVMAVEAIEGTDE